MAIFQPERLTPFAKRYIWWETPDEAILMPEHVVAQVMNIGDWDDVLPLEKIVGEEYLRAVLLNAEETLSVIARVDDRGGEVNLSFFGGFRLARVGEPRITRDGKIYFASLDDLMALKLAVILQRIEAKDCIDIEPCSNLE